MIVLGIETSCDETAVALVEDGKTILANLIASQIDIHRQFGGVIPELASRAHLKVLVPLLDRCFHQTGCGPAAVDAVAFTRGPGLIGGLLIGTAMAKAFAFAWGLPLIGVHHLKSHLYAPCLEGASLTFPLVGLIVSGGNTLLVHAASWNDARILGQTRDDAAGEAFDKVAGLLQLGYPGGAEIEAAARRGDRSRFHFPRGMIKSGDLDFSFSGIKTSVRYTLKKLEKENQPYRVEDIAASFQAAVVEVLVKKLEQAVSQTFARTVVLGGGVVRNTALREKILETFSPDRFRVLIPSPELCTDNAAMVAGLAYRSLQSGESDDLSVDADPNLPWGGRLL